MPDWLDQTFLIRDTLLASISFTGSWWPLTGSSALRLLIALLIHYNGSSMFIFTPHHPPKTITRIPIWVLLFWIQPPVHQRSQIRISYPKEGRPRTESLFWLLAVSYPYRVLSPCSILERPTNSFELLASRIVSSREREIESKQDACGVSSCPRFGSRHPMDSCRCLHLSAIPITASCCFCQ